MATKLQELLDELTMLKEYFAQDLLVNGLTEMVVLKDDLEELITKYTETTPTYKPGDSVRVLRNMFGHPFTLGEPIILTMTIDDPIEGIWSAIQEVGSLRGNITEAEFEPIN